MQVKHAAALIALLSVLGDEDLEDLGLVPQQITALDEVWEEANTHYEKIVGEEHPLARPSQREDDTMPFIIVVPPGTLWN